MHSFRSSATIGSDLLGRVYAYCSVDAAAISYELRKLRELTGDDRFRTLTNNRTARDGDAYHLTVVNPLELTPVLQRIALGIDGREFTFELVGLGRCSNSSNETWFVVATSVEAAEFRRECGFLPAEFHVTLGFDPDDVFDMPKGVSSLVSIDPRGNFRRASNGP